MEIPFLGARTSKLGVVNGAAGAVIALVVVLALKELVSLFEPLVVAVSLYYLTLPLFRWLVARKVPRAAAALVTVALSGGVVLATALTVGTELGALADRVPRYRERFEGRLGAVADSLAPRLPGAAERIRELARGRWIPPEKEEAFVASLVGAFLNYSFEAVLVLFYLIFIVHEARSLPARLKAAYGDARARSVLEIGERINQSILRYVYVKGFASFLVALTSLAAMMVFRLDHAWLWTLLIFFGNFIPYIGSAVAVLFPIGLGFLQFETWTAFLALSTVLLALQTWVGYYVEPVVSGHQLDLSPLVVMLTLAFWGWMWGLTGLLLAVPITVGAKLVLENIPDTRWAALLLSDFVEEEKRKP